MSDDLGKRFVGPAVRTARDRMGLTQAEVAELVGMATIVISRLERGLMLPSVPSLRRLCLALRFSADVALGLVEQVVPGGAPGLLEPDDSALVRRLLYLARKMDAAQLKALITVAQVILR